MCVCACMCVCLSDANRIFERAGLGFEAAVGVGLFKAVMTLVSVQLVDR